MRGRSCREPAARRRPRRRSLNTRACAWGARPPTWRTSPWRCSAAARRASGLQGAASGYGQPPAAAELLRFRERLERTARELSHDYDELLGRLRTAEPAAPGPTISFARGAPSLDIVDVTGLREAA